MKKKTKRCRPWDALAMWLQGRNDACAMMTRTAPAELLEARIAPAFSSIVDVSLLDGSDGRKFERPTPSAPDGFATALGGIGDINDDGIDDFVVSAPVAGSGSVYVVFGNNDVQYSELDVTTLDGFNGFRIDGATAGDLAGLRVSPAGDFNHDGVDDFILGAPGLGNDRGTAYLILGRTGTFAPVFTLGTSTSLTVVQLNGETAGDRAGASVGGIGDFNNDTYDDIIIGAPEALNGLGSAYVVFGGAVAGSSVTNLSAVNGTIGFRLVGELDHIATGADVAGIGDFNDDGFDDLIVGSSFTDPVPGSTSYVVFGKAGPFNTNVPLGNVDGTTGFKIVGGFFPGKGQHLSAAGDINADGFDDFLLSSALVKKGKTHAAAFAIFGHAAPFDAAFNLAALDGTNGFRVKFGKFQQLTFSSVSGAGDVNGDGIDDFMVGSAGFRGKPVAGMEADNGTSYVIFGHTGAYDKVFDAAVLDIGGGFSIVNDPSTKFFVTALNPAGDINFDGRDDILIGSGKVGDLGAAYAVFGQTVYIATDPTSKTVKFNDVDGDLVSITIPGHKLTQTNFTFNPDTGSPFAPAVAANDYSFFDLTLSPDFANSVVKIKTTRAAAGNGYMHVGRFDAPGIKLKNIKISGDVDSLNVGDGSGRSAIGTLDVQNLGPSLGLGHTTFVGSVNLLKVRGAMQNMTMDVGGGVASGVKKMLVKGDISNSQITSTGKLKMSVKGSITDSTIDAAIKISSLTVSGDVVDSTIRAVGDGSTAQTAKTEAIKRISVGGDFETSQILAGYDLNGLLLNGHARIGSVKVKGDWNASDLGAGINRGGDTYFGTADDFAVGLDFVAPSRIASIVIQGQLLSSAAVGDTFGFVAEQIDKFKIGGAAVYTPTPGANNDLAILSFGLDGDIAIHEVNAPAI